MADPALPGRVAFDGSSRSSLEQRLEGAGVQLNAHARTLLLDPVFDAPIEGEIAIIALAVGELGFPAGATLPRILAAARERELHPCPPQTGPYLRLAYLGQPSAPDNRTNEGRAPTASLTLVTERLSPDDDYPRGFYLRTIDGKPWLRGFRCDDDHVFSAHDRLVFRSR